MQERAVKAKEYSVMQKLKTQEFIKLVEGAVETESKCNTAAIQKWTDTEVKPMIEFRKDFKVELTMKPMVELVDQTA